MQEPKEIKEYFELQSESSESIDLTECFETSMEPLQSFVPASAEPAECLELIDRLEVIDRLELTEFLELTDRLDLVVDMALSLKQAALAKEESHVGAAESSCSSVTTGSLVNTEASFGFASLFFIEE